jgi:[ribosomal protein S18]-alanine N-acetyltransferase
MMSAYVARHMRLEDIPQVVTIDRESFPNPWPPHAYQFEISNRDTSHMIVLDAFDRPISGGRSWRGLFDRFFAGKTPDQIVGYGGCWLITGEAHISTIAVAPAFRGQGLGELLLSHMLLRAMLLDAEYSVLEVRESNFSAQALYRKYEYEVVGRRKGYYRDNAEDALLMEVRPLDLAYQTRLRERIDALARRVSFEDRFSNHAKP